jgi:hypothetical protein
MEEEENMDYNLDYFEKMLRLNSINAERIHKIRWEWIKDLNSQKVLDYGSGVGWFRAFRPSGVEVCSYDIGNFPQTGIKLMMYDVVCFWDVLEHLPDFGIIEPILALARNVSVSIPIIEGDLSESKHFKPGEHLHYFTQKSIRSLFANYGFIVSKTGTPECPPRESIHSFIFGRAK